MRKDLRRRHDAQVRANGMCTQYSAVFDATPGGQKARTALATSVADVDRLLALQERSIEDRRAATAQLRSGRQTLGDAAKAVVKIGGLVTSSAASWSQSRSPAGGSTTCGRGFAPPKAWPRMRQPQSITAPFHLTIV